MTLVNGVTLALALLGAVLGVINTWHALDKSRVKLRIRPKHAIPFGGTDARLNFCIEITNLSAFAVTVEEAGVALDSPDKRLAYTSPVLIDEGGWPRRLEPRTSVTIYGQAPSTNGLRLKCTYATTSCGVTKEGTSPAFRQMAKRSG
ncbi:hypothetical protein [Pseudomonas arsenicoxydans]|uniref:hypothetical protein n=1 Tax=Pseudomonas arsenicoxydans TaxID=702115 RepID=UPI001ABF8977|nr:hypothetical protein [Pseudomonas arsenicoxydans]